jgi:hypothetical protein
VFHSEFNKSRSAVWFDGLDRAYFDACAAVRALIRIDGVNGIAFADGLNRTFRNAGTAGDTFFIDFMSHASLLWMGGCGKISGKFSEYFSESQPLRHRVESDHKQTDKNGSVKHASDVGK